MKYLLIFLRVGALTLTLLLMLVGCGNDKYTTPVSDIVYDGPKPKRVEIDVNPSSTHIQYFKFKLQMSDPNQSTLEKDHWTIEGCKGYFTVDMTTSPFVEPLPDIDVRNPVAVATTYSTIYPLTLVTKEWIERNCHSLVGSQTIVPVTVYLQFYAHRNGDNLRVVIPVEFSFTIGDY